MLHQLASTPSLPSAFFLICISNVPFFTPKISFSSPVLSYSRISPVKMTASLYSFSPNTVEPSLTFLTHISSLINNAFYFLFLSNGSKMCPFFITIQLTTTLSVMSLPKIHSLYGFNYSIDKNAAILCYSRNID